MEIIVLLAGVVYGLIIGLIPAAGATTGLIALFGFIPFFMGMDPIAGRQETNTTVNIWMVSNMEGAD